MGPKTICRLCRLTCSFLVLQSIRPTEFCFFLTSNMGSKCDWPSSGRNRVSPPIGIIVLVFSDLLHSGRLSPRRRQLRRNFALATSSPLRSARRLAEFRLMRRRCDDFAASGHVHQRNVGRRTVAMATDYFRLEKHTVSDDDSRADGTDSVQLWCRKI